MKLMKSLWSVLLECAAELPDKPLFVFPETRWTIEERLTYSQLATKSAACSRIVAQVSRSGERALLLFPSGAAFWEAFFGCLVCGVVAVPLKVPNLCRDSKALEKICQDCAP